MGGWDCYCAFCAAPFSVFDPFNQEGHGEPGQAFDGGLLGVEDMEWLKNIRVLGFNPNAAGVSKCYITGPASEQEYGSMECEVGDDPNVPPDPFGNTGAERTNIAAYSDYDPDEPLAIPFHFDCLRLFARALQYQLHGRVGREQGTWQEVVDKDVLYAAMGKLHEEYAHVLNLDYGELDEEKNEQYWGCQVGQEAWVTNPLSSLQISSFLLSLRDTRIISPSSSPPRTSSSAAVTSASSNPLTRLPKEVLCEIALCLPYTDLQHFALSGLLPFSLSSMQSFWHRILKVDMPYLWDLPPLEGQRDWFSIYHELRKHCFATTPRTERNAENLVHIVGERDRSLILGLANRRRVWNTCSRLAELYTAEMPDPDAGESREVSKEILDGSESVVMPIVASPVGKDAKYLSTYLIAAWKDLDGDIELIFHFKSADEEGKRRLCGVERVGQRVFGERGESINMLVKEGNWIQGLELNVGGAEVLDKDASLGVTGLKLIFQDGSEEQVGADGGDKRLMAAGEGKVITGLIGELANGVIQRLGLLQCPRGTSTTTIPATPPSLQRHLWKSALPPPNIQATNYQTGYWTPVRSYDTIPMQALLLAQDSSDLSKVAGFSSDAKMRSFAVHFDDGTERRIGPNDADESERKVFKIDGAGGEVVRRVEVGMNSLPMAIKITTNRDRIAFFGENQKNAHEIYEPPSDNVFIAGIYASWGYSAEDKQCTTISVLSASKDGEQSGNVEITGASDPNAWSPPGIDNARLVMQGWEAIAVAGEADYEEFAGRWW